MGVLKSICFNGMCNEIPDMLSFEVVDQLPATGTGGIIYLVPNADAYDEYVWTDDGFFKIGTTNEVSVEEIEREIRELKETKANIDGYYPNLHVGTANQLLADTYTTDEEPYHYRQTPSHAGTREMDEIVGGSVVWNQLMPDETRSNTNNGITYTRVEKAPYILNGTATAQATFILTTANIPVKTGDKILFTGGKSSNIYLTLTNATIWVRHINPTDKGTGGIGNAETNGNLQLALIITNGTTCSNDSVNPQLHNLTAMFGSTIADHIYALEQATAGAGVEFFRKYFPEEYYAYDEGTMRSVEGLVSHVTVGFNQWDEEWEVGSIDASNGDTISRTDRVRSKNYIPVLPSVTYYAKTPILLNLYFYDASKAYITDSFKGANNATFITPVNAYYLKLVYASTTYNHDICINISNTSKNGQYEPYEKHSYPLDSTVTLRGIPQLVDGQLKFDGDTYSADGVVTRKYGIVDLGTLSWNLYPASGNFKTRFTYTGYNNIIKKPNTVYTIPNILCTKYKTDTDKRVGTADDADKSMTISPSGTIYVRDSSYSDATTFKTAMSGVMLVYELATPTTEQAEPYQSLQICSPYGTEEYVTTGIVPVGHYTKYPTDLKGIVEQIADAPSADGTYTLKATVSGGKVTYSWESA